MSHKTNDDRFQTLTYILSKIQNNVNEIACAVFFANMTACGISLFTSDKNTIPKTFLLFMVYVALQFHLWYVWQENETDTNNTRDRGGTNKLKWAEYAISATSGSLAVSSMNEWNSEDSLTIAFIILLGIFTQVCGFLIEREFDQPDATFRCPIILYFLMGCCAFLAELWLSIAGVKSIEDIEKNQYAIISTYTTLYAAFPVICAKQWSMVSKATKNKKNDLDTLYHIASVLSKTGLVWTILSSEAVTDEILLAASIPYVIITIIILIMMYYGNAYSNDCSSFAMNEFNI